jgi:uncharacterized protein (DUF697 family)
MMAISKNGVAVLLLLATFFRIDIDEALANDVVAAIGLLVSVGLMLWNQFGRRDLKWGLFRK